MHGTKVLSNADTLRQRRQNVGRTLKHIQTERRELESNRQCMHKMAYESRVRLLERLAQHYGEEMKQIARALRGNSSAGYRVCTSCYSPIEGEALLRDPDAKICVECEEYRQTVGFRICKPS
jgi:RNA polymerase-binding transcription factor DksA